MSLLRRVAIGQGDKQRKEDAYRLLKQKEKAVVARWHQRLEAEIDRRRQQQQRQEGND